ncbi:hypothetical protein D1007_19763 [Hordeum vulgare]|nr:hypothetical protein D1007_19763 [Hordeum vulgare]
MEGIRPCGLWLRADGCCNGHVWAAVDLSLGSAMFLTHGWKSFPRSRGFGLCHLLHFRFDGSATLYLKLFGMACFRLQCSAERSSGNDFDSSSETRTIVSMVSRLKETTPSSSASVLEGFRSRGLARVDVFGTIATS